MSSGSDLPFDPFSRYPGVTPVYRKTTTTGRIVYNRRAHMFNWKAIARIIEFQPAVEPGSDPAVGALLNPSWGNEWLAWLRLTGKILESITSLGIEILQELGVGKIMLPIRAIQWLLPKLLQLVPEEMRNVPEFWEPEQYGAALSGLTVELEGEHYA